METRAGRPAWGRLIEEARERLRPAVSQNEAGRRLGITGTYWRQVVKGEVGELESPRGVRRLAAMAKVVEVTPDEMDDVGRPDVAKALRELLEPEDASARMDRLYREWKEDQELQPILLAFLESRRGKSAG